jgi:hypothetical protein
LFTVAPEFKAVAPFTVRPPFDIDCPPFTDNVERKIEEGSVGVPLGGGYTAPLTELTLIFAVLIKTVLRLFILAVLLTMRGVAAPTKRFTPFTVAPPFKNVPLVVVRVLLKDVGTLKIAWTGLIVFAPQLSVPAPTLDRFPLTVAVERATVEVMPVPPPGGSPLMLLTVRLLIATAGIVAVGWMTGTH